MRTALWGMVIAGSTLAGWLSLGAGCGVLPDECSQRFNCLAGSGGVATTTTSSSAGGDSGPPPQCVPELLSGPVDDECGIFVSSSKGNDTAVGVGSKKLPYKTLAAAVDAAAKTKTKTRVYACAESFTESVTLAGATGLFGGLDCLKDWSYVEGTKAKLTADAGAVPLTLSNTAPSVVVADFEVRAADAVADGGSSIAVVTDAITASFTRCDLIAGNGVKGADGMMLGESPGPSKPTDLAIAGNNGQDACTTTTNVSGGDQKENTLCMLSANPLGGTGGMGTVIAGNNGETSPANLQTALGGIGQKAANLGWGCFAGSGLGDGGANGQPGSDGAGATGATSLGALTLAGYVGIAGQPGTDGAAGQGGGGGGAAKGKAGCGGASGGGGGAGGCGGYGGTGGKAGGASIGLVSLGATLSFDQVNITLGNGGAGGDGGEGHSGRIGGNGGIGGAGSGAALSACDGGKGGQGGFGGKGGGGRGGHAIGIAASGATAPSKDGVTVTAGTPGVGGTGGTSQDGEAGVQADVQLFP
jgi:hypothetical protein